MLGPYIIIMIRWLYRSIDKHVSSTITFISGRTSGPRNVIHDGYRFCLDKKRDDKTYWRCTDKTYSGRLNLMNDTAVTNSKPHPHPLTPAANSVYTAKQNMKRKASDTDLPTKHLITDVIGPLSFKAMTKPKNQRESLAQMASTARAPDKGHKASCCSPPGLSL